MLLANGYQYPSATSTPSTIWIVLGVIEQGIVLKVLSLLAYMYRPPVCTCGPAHVLRGHAMPT